MGRIYEERGAREDQCWVWSLFGILANPPGMHTDGRAPTLEAAKADFEADWQQWLRWLALVGGLDSIYRSGRSPDWLKMKNANAPAARR